jgi:cytochrome c biogenesis protein CcmG/thiol:disulfide interchange protein DsbE
VPWLAAIVVLSAAVAHLGGGNTASGAGGKARVGRPAPDFTLQLFNGESVRLSGLKGKPVLVNFWHSG